MSENQNTKKRLLQFIMFKNISVHRFETEVGLSNGYVKNMRNSIQPDKVRNIVLKFPDLNPGWLLTGEGEMLRSEGGKQSSGKPVESPASDRDNVQSLLSSNRELVQQHGELIAQHTELIRQQGELIEMIKVLVSGELSAAEPKKSRV